MARCIGGEAMVAGMLCGGVRPFGYVQSRGGGCVASLQLYVMVFGSRITLG